MKGFCEGSEESVDDEFVFKPGVLVDGKPVWKGFSTSIIQWSSELQAWQILNISDNMTIATLNITNNFPVGLHYWTINNPGICEHSGGDRIELMVSRCGREEFSCGDGICLPIEKKCDYVKDCWDILDEENCRLSIIKDFGAEYYRPDQPFTQVVLL